MPARHQLQRTRAVHSFELRENRIFNSVDIMKTSDQPFTVATSEVTIEMQQDIEILSPRSPRRKSLIIHNLHQSLLESRPPDILSSAPNSDQDHGGERNSLSARAKRSMDGRSCSLSFKRLWKTSIENDNVPQVIAIPRIVKAQHNVLDIQQKALFTPNGSLS